MFPQKSKAGNSVMKKHPRKCAKLVSVLAIFCLALSWAAASARATAIEHQFVPREIQFGADTDWPHTDPANAGIRVEFQLPPDRLMK